MVITTDISTQDMINKLQSLSGKTKIKFYKNISNYFDNMTLRMVEDPLTRKAQGVTRNYHEVFLLKILYRQNLGLKP